MTDQIMAESKPHKPGLFRRILWWLWVILLTALLVFGLVFAAPWKVITLIAIFLIAATILPGIYRKWFWLGVGIVVLAIIVWIFLPDDNKGWKPYQFDKETAQLKAKYAVPDSENAAIIYNQILADWEQKEVNEPNLPHEKFDSARRNFWLTKDQPEVTEYMQYYQDTIKKVLQATKFEKCSLAIASSIFMDTGRLSAFRRWAYLLVAAGNNDTAEGNTNEAIEKYLAAIRLGQHEYQQPEYTDKLVGMSCEGLGLNGINNLVVLGDANEFYLDKLAKAVSSIRYDWNTELPSLITIDKLIFKNTFGSLYYKVNSNGKIRFNDDPSEIIREQLRKESVNGTIDISDILFGYWRKKLTKASTIPTWFYLPATPEEFSQIVDASYEKLYTMTKPDFNWTNEPNAVPIEPLFQFKINFRQLLILMATMNEKLYFSIHDLFLRNSAEQRGTLLIIALRRYKNANGHWPESLDDVKTLVSAETFVDPMNNSSFVYKRTDDGFTLYSKGKNGIDDGGIDSDTEDKGGPDDLLIWPHKSKVSRQQEQKTEN
jgi:hypothetical protein